MTCEELEHAIRAACYVARDPDRHGLADADEVLRRAADVRSDLVDVRLIVARARAAAERARGPAKDEASTAGS